MYAGDNIDFLYILHRHGWSTALLFIDGQTISFWITHLFSDPTDDLAQLAIKLHKRVETAELVWSDEPGGHSLCFTRVPDQHHRYDVRVSYFPEGPPLTASRTGDVLIEFQVKADQFVTLIYSQLEKLARLLEDRSYSESREFPFPTFKRLRAELTR